MILKERYPKLYEQLQLLKMDLNHFKVLLFAKRNKGLLPFKNKHKGERCFIVATGPSLTAADLNLIKDEICIGVNTCVRAFEKTYWRPNYYCIMDERIWPDIRKDVESKANEVETFFIGNEIETNLVNIVKIKRDERASTFLETQYYKRTSEMLKRCKCYLPNAKVMERYLCDGPTVVYSALELAIFMGFKDIYLIGTDCNYQGTTQHSKLAGYNSKLTTIPQNVEDKLFSCYRAIKSEIESQHLDVNIYNATRGGMLEVFERRNLEDVLAIL